MTIIRIEDASIFIGLTLDKAIGQITDSGYTPLLTKTDKVTKEIVKDYDPLRVLIQTEKDVVTVAKIG